MEAELKAALNLSHIKFRGSARGGCIHEGNIFDTENGPIFAKISKKNSEAKSLFNGEIAGLKAIQSTKTVRVPNPIKVVDLKKGTCLVMEYVDMKSLGKHAEQLGELLARMHLYNSSLIANGASVHKDTSEDDVGGFVDKFGFSCTTYCGRIAQDNTWKTDWVEFFIQQKIDFQLRMVEAEYADGEARELWSELSLKIPELFKDLDITPSLLHGDLWSGNASGSDEGPVIYDPAAFYGHDEFDLAIAKMFGGFPQSFYSSYHKIIPKKPNFERRLELYQLFHYLNHWNHFGTGYRDSSVSIMRNLLKMLK